MDRLLSPNEAKFWLMDRAGPMNSVIVTELARDLDPAGLTHGSAFVLPTIVLGRHQRPRWSHRPEDVVPGVLTVTEGDDMHWLDVAAGLLDQPVGTAGQPNWRATLIRQPRGTTVVLAVNHALTDWRSSLWVADQFLAGRHPGAIAPACEELLPPSVFGDAGAEDLIEAWLSARAAERWEAIGLDRLAGVMPPPVPSRIACHRFGATETAAFQDRCAAEGVTLNGAVAVALRDEVGARAIAHSVDLHRFIRPPLPPAPGIAVSHLFTAMSDTADFWEAAREVRGALFAEIQAGAHGDALLILPKVMLQGVTELASGRSDHTITGFPTYRAPGQAAADPDRVMQFVLSSARGGGDIALLSHYADRLQLLSICPADSAGFDIAGLADRLCRAAA